MLIHDFFEMGAIQNRKAPIVHHEINCDLIGDILAKFCWIVYYMAHVCSRRTAQLMT